MLILEARAYLRLWISKGSWPCALAAVSCFQVPCRPHDIDLRILHSGFNTACDLGGLEVSLGTVEWHRSSYGTDFENSEIAGPVKGPKQEDPEVCVVFWAPDIQGSPKQGLLSNLQCYIILHFRFIVQYYSRVYRNILY